MKRDRPSTQQKGSIRPTEARAGGSKAVPAKEITMPGGSSDQAEPAAGEDGGQPTVDPISEASTGGPPRGKEFKKVSVSREQAPPESKRLRVAEYPRLTVYIDPKVKDRFDAAAKVLNTPAYQLFTQALEQFLEQLPEADRDLIEMLVRRRGSGA